MSLTNVIARFSTAAADGASGGYTVTRSTGGAMNANGEWVSGTTSTFLMDACIQNSAGRQIIPLPEGVHTEDTIEIDTTIALQLIPIPDHITYRGDDYTIFRVDGPRNLDGGSNYTAYGARQRHLP